MAIVTWLQHSRHQIEILGTRRTQKNANFIPIGEHLLIVNHHIYHSNVYLYYYYSLAAEILLYDNNERQKVWPSNPRCRFTIVQMWSLTSRSSDTSRQTGCRRRAIVGIDVISGTMDAVVFRRWTVADTTTISTTVAAARRPRGPSWPATVDYTQNDNWHYLFKRDLNTFLCYILSNSKDNSINLCMYLH